MKLELFTLCDYARGEPSGKLYIIGTFDHIFGLAAPFPLPACAIAARLRFAEFEQGAQQVKVSFVDSDGVRVIPDIGVQMNIQLPPGESTVTANVVVVLPLISLPRFGEYSIDLTVGGGVEGSIPLYARRAPQSTSVSRPS